MEPDFIRTSILKSAVFAYSSYSRDAAVGQEEKSVPLVVIVSTAQIHSKENEDLLDIVVDEYLAELNDESTGVSDDANDIMVWVFGDEVFEGDEDFEGDKNFIDNEPSDSEH